MKRYLKALKTSPHDTTLLVSLSLLIFGIWALYRAKKTPAKIGNVFVYFLLTLVISTYKYLDMIL